MKPEMKLGVVLLAAGKSSRFGENKLLADFDGRPMICRTLEAVRAVCAARIAVVTGNETVERLAASYGYDVIANHEPELGQAHSIRLGVRAMRDMDAVLLMVCDQPLLQSESLVRLISAFSSDERGIACLRDGTHSGNPAVFASRYFPDLLALEGDRGAKGILRAHAQDVTVVDCLHPMELSDADDPQAFSMLRENAL